MTATIVTHRADHGPAPYLSLAECHAAGCAHRECARAARAHRRLSAPVPAAGTTRRLRALAYNGFAVPDLAGRLGARARVVRWITDGGPSHVPAALAADVARLYDALWHLDGGCTKATKAARARGWCPPLGWDEDRPGEPWYTGHGIDDPHATPAPGWERTPKRGRLTLAEQAGEVADTMAFHDLSYNQAALRLGISGEKLQKLRDYMASAVAS